MGRTCDRPANFQILELAVCWQHERYLLKQIKRAVIFEPDARRAAQAGLSYLREQEENELRQRQTTNRASRPSFVYFARREELIKIGVTTNIKKRLNDISKGNSMPEGMTVGPVELLVTTPGDRSLEGRLHDEFAEYRVARTEWFESAPPLLRLVRKLQHRAAAIAA
jgi:T5orf172 domain-containing protein